MCAHRIVPLSRPPPSPMRLHHLQCSSAQDLRRARIQDARACFVLSDRLAGDTEAQDKKALVRALCANQASPPGPDGASSVLCLVTHSRSKVRLVRLGMPPSSVVCYDEVMEVLVTKASLVSEREGVREGRGGVGSRAGMKWEKLCGLARVRVRAGWGREEFEGKGWVDFFFVSSFVSS